MTKTKTAAPSPVKAAKRHLPGKLTLCGLLILAGCVQSEAFRQSVIDTLASALTSSSVGSAEARDALPGQGG